jgi:hypothetical protein
MTGGKGRPGTDSLISKVCSGMTFAYRDNLTRRRFFGGIEIVRAVLSVCSPMIFIKFWNSVSLCFLKINFLRYCFYNITNSDF